MENLTLEGVLVLHDDGTAINLAITGINESRRDEWLERDEVEKVHQWLGEWLMSKAEDGNYGRGE